MPAVVSTGTLFHYFPDKNKLVGALYISIKKEMADLKVDIVLQTSVEAERHGSAENHLRSVRVQHHLQ